MGGRRGLLFGALLACGCSPLVIFEGVVTVSGVEEPVSERLHLSARADVGSPPKRLTTEDGQLFPKLAAEDDEIHYVVRMDGVGLAEFDVQFWYDHNGDGVRDPGDRVGRPPAPVIGEDRGWSVQTELETIVLSEPPSTDGWVAWPPLPEEAAPTPTQQPEQPPSEH